jgi:hypothetical protein
VPDLKKIVDAICNGEPVPDGVMFHVSRGSSSETCRCRCGEEPRGPCEHKWDGPDVDMDGGWSRSCSRCGMTAMSHDMWLF